MRSAIFAIWVVLINERNFPPFSNLNGNVQMTSIQVGRLQSYLKLSFRAFENWPLLQFCFILYEQNNRVNIKADEQSSTAQNNKIYNHAL